MYKGIIIENSLTNTDILDDFKVIKQWSDGDWKLNEVEVTRDQLLKLPSYIDEGPWYIHFWEPSKSEIIVVFKNKTFTIDASNTDTWNEAIAYGKSIGIPEEQLDFPIT